MARGWESKAVADQIEEENEAKARRVQSQEVSPEERAKQERLASLQLSKARLLEQLERAKHPAYRGVLLNGLKAIENEIDQLSSFPLTPNSAKRT